MILVLILVFVISNFEQTCVVVNHRYHRCGVCVGICLRVQAATSELHGFRRVLVRRAPKPEKVHVVGSHLRFLSSVLMFLV